MIVNDTWARMNGYRIIPSVELGSGTRTSKVYINKNNRGIIEGDEINKIEFQEIEFITEKEMHM